MAKLVYEALFNWIVVKINKALANAIASPEKKARIPMGAFKTPTKAF